MNCIHETKQVSTVPELFWCSKCGAIGDPYDFQIHGPDMPEVVKFGPALRAAQIITEVMEAAEGSGKHTPGSWQNEGMEHHLDHVDDHLDEVTALVETIHRDGTLADPHVREEFEHALCRLSMAICCAEKGVLEDYGHEGEKYGYTFIDEASDGA